MIVRDGLRRMYEEGEDVFYYITVMNENYRQPPLPAGVEIIPPWPEDHDGATDIYMDGMYRRHFRTKTVQHRRWQKELE